MQAPVNAKQAAISVVVRRADGSVEDYGVVSYYHRQPLRRWLFALRRRFGRVSEQALFGGPLSKPLRPGPPFDAGKET